MCHRCENEPCTCQKAGVSEPAKQKYLFKKCENRDCTVMIGWVIGARQGQATCKHCQAGVAHWQREAVA